MVTPLLFDHSLYAAESWLTMHRGAENQGWKRCAECRAVQADLRAGASDHGAEQGTVILTPRRVGEPVWTEDLGQDINWVVAVDPELRVAAFDSPSAPNRDERVVQRRVTTAFQPHAGDRCYVEEQGRWVEATVSEDPEDDAIVAVVERRGEVTEVPLTSLRFRPLSPVRQPLTELAERRPGSISRHRARAEFTDSYWQLAKAGRGLLGVLSASVELHAHQVGVARRVLADPVQRYLLADEVGLGKTIEAGLIIRQRLIDAPRSVVRIVVPDALCWQWESELEDKFQVSEFGGVELFGFEDKHAFHPGKTPDLLVIDEAHRIASGWNSHAKESRERFELARTLAHQVPRILLLSATPVLHREADLLAMLHLLDPDTHRLEGLDAFKAMVADREQIGELLLALRPGRPAFLLRPRLPELLERFPQDGRLRELVQNITDSLDGGSDQRDQAVAEARVHLNETYRLHSRLLRNRRSGIEDSGYTVRKRSGVRVIVGDDNGRGAIDEWLESWRVTLLTEAHERGGEEELTKAANAFLVYLGCAIGDLTALYESARFRLTLKRQHRQDAGLTFDEAATMRAFELSDTQRNRLQELVDLLEAMGVWDSSIAQMAAAIEQLEENAILVFVTSASTAEALRVRLGERAQCYTVTRTDEARRACATAFLESTERRILICDRSGEEGVNLQSADCIVHGDLPLSNTRIEQRTGRVDRYDKNRGPVISYVINPGPAAGFGRWWLDVLTHSFEAFNATTAPLQYAIEAVQASLLSALALEGVDDATLLLPQVRARVLEEQIRIDKLDTLDALARLESDDVQFVEQVLLAEQQSAGHFADAVGEALRTASTELGLIQITDGEGDLDVVLCKQPPALRVYQHLFDQRMSTTADRGRAASNTLEPMTLLRPGAPLVEALRLQLAWDERCQTGAAWIHDEAVDEPLLAVRCELLLRADPTPAFTAWKQHEAERPRTAAASRTDADAPLAVAALQRRLDAYLPPQPLIIWIDQHGRRIDDLELVSRLDDIATKASDQTWSDERWDAVARQTGAVSIDDVIMPLNAKVEALALEDTAIQAISEHAWERARTDMSETRTALQLRADLSSVQDMAQRDLEDEERTAGLLLNALRTPIVEWCAALMVFLTPKSVAAR